MASEEKKRTIKDIEWVTLRMPDGSQEEACSVADARVYLGVSEPGLTKILHREQVTRYERGFGSKKFILKKDLDKLLEARPATD